MKVLWLSWKDRTHPEAGGAEVVKDELCKRLIADGHQVTQLVGGYPGAEGEVNHDGIRVIRVGGFYTVYFLAPFYYFRHLRNWADIIIEEVNTAPFGTPYLYPKKQSTKRFLFIHQLTREIWFYEKIPFPFTYFFYYLEPVLLWLQRTMQVITISESTKNDLKQYGFQDINIHIISEGLKDVTPISSLDAIQKYDRPTLLSFSAMRPMKRTLDIIKAFEIAKQSIPDLQLLIAGDDSGAYVTECKTYIASSPHKNDITVLGRVSQKKKFELMQKSHLHASCAIREGWGLTITEANSQGTPAVAYDTPGLRDSIRSGVTGVLTRESTPASLADAMVSILKDPEQYATLRRRAWEWSHDITFDQSYTDFKKALTI